MWNLIHKDVRILKKLRILILLYIAFIAYLGIKLDQFTTGFYILSMFILTYYSIWYLLNDEEKNKSNYKVDNNMIVTEKYYLLYIYIIFVWTLLFIFTNLYKLLGIKVLVRTSNFQDLIILFLVLQVFYLIYYPIYFKYGSLKMRTLNVMLYLGIFMIPSVLESVTNKEWTKKYGIMFLQNMNKVELYSLLFLAGIIISIISYFISKVLYGKGKI